MVFSRSPLPTAFKTFFLHSLLCMAFTLTALTAYPQFIDYGFQAKDSQITVLFSHDDGGVIMTVTLANASKFEYLQFKRSMNERVGFKPCHYIKLGNGINNKMTIVERDKFAIPASLDAFYIVEAVMSDGTVITSPVIRLPKLRGPS